MSPTVSSFFRLLPALSSRRIALVEASVPMAERDSRGPGATSVVDHGGPTDRWQIEHPPSSMNTPLKQTFSTILVTGATNGIVRRRTGLEHIESSAPFNS